MTSKNRVLVFGYGTLQHTPSFLNFDSQLYGIGAKYVCDAVLPRYMVARVPIENAFGEFRPWSWAGIVDTGLITDFVCGEVFSVPKDSLISLDLRESYFGDTDRKTVYRRESLKVVVRSLPDFKSALNWPTTSEVGDVLDVEAYTVTYYPKADWSVLTHTWPEMAEEVRRWGRHIRLHAELSDNELNMVRLARTDVDKLQEVGR